MSTLLSMRTYIFIMLGFLFFIITAFTIFLVNSNMREQALLEAKSKSRLLLDSNLATHTYFTKILKPSLFQTVQPFTTKDYFDPTWMSSTYAVGHIQGFFKHFSPEPYLYKEASIDARSTDNEADNEERLFLDQLKNDKELTLKSSIRVIEGKPYLTVMRRGEEMENSCLRCHSTPEEAPKDLVARYGPEKSFNRKVDEVVQAISIKIPLYAAYGNADYFSLKLSAFLMSAFLGCFTLFFVFLRSYMVSPLGNIRDEAVLIAENPELIGAQITRPKVKELGELVDAFNKMSANLKKSYESLEERVQLRTTELTKSKELLEHEILERKKAEAGLKDSEATLKTLLNTAPVGVGLVIDRNFQWTNKTLSEMTGFDNEELNGRSSRIIYPDDAEFLRVGELKYKEILKTGKGQIQTCFKTKDGSLIDVLLKSSAIDPDNLSDGVVFTAMDITELQQAQSALKESEAKYRLLTENMTDVIWSISEDLEYTYVSPSIRNQLGYEPEEVLGKSLPQFVSPIFCDQLIDGFEKRIQQFHRINDFSSLTLIIKQTRKDGSDLWNELLANPIVGEKGELTGFQGVSRDISDRMKAEKDKMEIERQLLHAQKLESLGVMSGGIAHDFNNLLTVIMGNLQLASFEIPPENEVRPLLENAMKAARKSAELSRQMLAYSGKGVFEVTDVNLNDIVIQNAQIFGTAIPKTINLEIDLGEKTPFVKADPGQIQQIMMNLITNAAEALDTKVGTIRISTGVRYCDKSLLASGVFPENPEPQDMAYLEVLDNGCGMDSATISRIFDPFYTTKFTGRGLGMSVVHGIVRAHDGAIIVNSEPGQGTKITVYLPVSKNTHQSSLLQSPESSNSITLECQRVNGTILVLVVDDEPDVNELVCKMLTKQGVNTISAFDGKQAVEIFNSNPDSFCLVILDLTMPEMDGVETFKKIREIRSNIKVVMSSGYDADEVLKKFGAHNNLPDDFLKKPFNFESVSKVMAELASLPK